MTNKFNCATNSCISQSLPEVKVLIERVNLSSRIVKEVFRLIVN